MLLLLHDIGPYPYFVSLAPPTLHPSTFTGNVLTDYSSLLEGCFVIVTTLLGWKDGRTHYFSFVVQIMEQQLLEELETKRKLQEEEESRKMVGHQRILYTCVSML